MAAALPPHSALMGLLLPFQHILQAMNLKTGTGVFMASTLVSPRVHHGKQKASSAVKMVKSERGG